MQSLEIDLRSFKQILPRLDPRRGLFNPAGQVLKAPFGTAVISDITSLHLVSDKLQQQQQQSDIVHSLTDQVTYIEDVDKNTRLNQETIRNLSTVVKNNMIASHDRIQQITCIV
jgi:hypothetical protein